MAQENPFKNWSQPFSVGTQLEERFVQESPKASLEDERYPHFASQPAHQVGLSHAKGSNFLSRLNAGLSSLDSSSMNQLAELIAENITTLIEQKNLLVDRVKLEELKVDNQLMARHIYSLIQKRSIQDKQVEHLQREQRRVKKLFWKFYIRED